MRKKILISILCASLVALTALAATVSLSDMPNESRFGTQVKGLINANIDAIQAMLDFSGDATLGTDGAVVVVDAAFTSVPTTSVGVGVVSNANTVVEYGDGINHKSVITLVGNTLTVTDGGFIDSVTVYTFPEGHIAIEGATINATATLSSTNFNESVADLYNLSVGTAESAAGDGTLTGTSVTIIPSTSIDTVSATTMTNGWTNGSTAHAFVDGSGTASAILLNMGVPAANDLGANTNVITGTLTVFWKNLGDY